MGIPAFYRWLVERYPKSVVGVVSEPPRFANGVLLPVDSSGPNPNGLEFDNLYLDMNGIVHPCFHPDDRPAPTSYDEVFKSVFKYIDHIFSLVRPRKLLFMAIDGVAPRAKMNQQRSRRFRSAKDAADAAAEAEKSKDELERLCQQITQPEGISKMDSNVITPGTEFMVSLSRALCYYIQLRLNSDPGWRGIKVILSDANVPGEGEHKIASYIRAQRNLPGFDPNTRHCLYGLDADLIMLALATHEIHFSILREDVRKVRRNEKIKSTIIKNKRSHQAQKVNEEEIDDISRIKFQFLHIWILREYLEHDLRTSGALLKADFEHLIDDFVFICLFVGNDFLPHIPSLEIREGAIDLLMNVYKKEFARMGGYLTNSSEVNLERVEHFLQIVGSHECTIFQRRIQMRKGHVERMRDSASKLEAEDSGSNWMEGWREPNNIVCTNSSKKRVSCVPTKHKVRVVEEGWKERYYAEKFEVTSECDRTKLKKHAVMKYVEGICWFMHYYYQGVCSWQWFYPYHYAPFASDFVDLKDLDINFTLGAPFKPFDQLMGVLPAASAHALPSSYRNLMTDPSSCIIDFYPPDFELDLNGKRFSWQAVCKLPFVDESRLLQEIGKVEHTLTDDEKKRNSCMMDALFVNISHPISSKIIHFYRKRKDHPKLSKLKLKKKLDPTVSGGMNGCVYISEKTLDSLEIYSPVEGMETIKKNQTIFVYYKGPPNQLHIPRIPPGATIPEKLISKKDVLRRRISWYQISARHSHINSRSEKIRNHEFGGKRRNPEFREKASILGKRKRRDSRHSNADPGGVREHKGRDRRSRRGGRKSTRRH